METVFHLSSGDPDEQSHALANVANLLADGTVDVDVAMVVNGDGAFALLEHEPTATQVRDLIEDGVDVCVCSNSLEARDLAEPELVDGVDVVSSGVGELTRRQASGAAYVKVP